MSQNQTRGEKKEYQYRKTGGGGTAKPINSSGPPHRSYSGGNGTASSLSFKSSDHNRSFKKSYNGQGGQPRGNSVSVNTSANANPAGSARPVENGSHVRVTAPGVSHKPARAAIPSPSDTATQKSSQLTCDAPSSGTSSLTSDSTSPSTPSKGDAGKGFPLQFGSISSVVMNGMQVPARTSSAPPDMDELQRDQARRAASRAAPANSIASAYKQKMPKKDVPIEESVAQETHTISKATRDVEMTAALPPMQGQKPSVLPMAGISMPMPYHQPTVPMQFGGPNPQIQSQGMPPNSLQMQMQMPLPLGNPSQVQQPVFVPGLQHHLMQNQGIMHQGQSFGFNPQLGHQLPHQLGNMGMNIPPQFNQQQAGKFGSGRKTVKITHPETHEELRLDDKDGGSTVSRSHYTGHSQSQSVPPYTATRLGGFYPNTAGSHFFPTPNSLPPSSISQAPRFNYPVQVPPSMPFMKPSAPNNFSVSMGAAPVNGSSESSDSDLVRSATTMLPSPHLASAPVTVKVASASAEDRGTSKSIEKQESQNLLRPVTEAAAVQKDMEGAPVQPGKKGHVHSSPQVTVKSDSVMVEDHGDSSKVTTHESVEPKINSAPSDTGEDIMKDSLANIDAATSGGFAVNHDVEGEEAKVRPTELDCYVQSISEKHGGVLGGPQSVSSPEAMHAVKNSEQGGGNKCEYEVDNMEASQADETKSSQSKGEKMAMRPPSAKHESIASDPSHILNSAPSLSRKDILGRKEIYVPKSSLLDKEATSNLDADLGQEVESSENTRPNSSSGSVSISNRTSVEQSKTKNSKGRKKRKEMLQKAEALGATADLYMAFKGPEESKEPGISAEGRTNHDVKELSPGVRHDASSVKKKEEQHKMELENWEDAADASIPKLESSEHQSSHQYDDGAKVKKYSRDFLLTISEQCIDLPQGFEITSDIADILVRLNVNASHDYPLPGQTNDRSSGAGRLDRRGSGPMDADRWGKPAAHSSGRDAGIDFVYGHMGFRPGPGANYGVVRSRGQGPVQHGGGILSGPMHSMGFQGQQRNNPDGDRWQRATNFNKGLMPSPQTPSPAVHRAERKYEVGKVSDEEQVKQRRLKSILNKLTPQNFDKLFEQVKEVNIDNAVTLTGVISQIFDKALMEPTFCEMYANFCYYLASELPDLSVDDQKITFRRLLLNKCQEEFERGEREEEEANKCDGEGETKQSDQEREEKRLKARRRMLGNIRLIGELYKKRMLTERIMHECIMKLLGHQQNADEENIEALCKLMSTIGGMIDHTKAKEHMDAYFDIMRQLSDNMKLSSRVRFMLKDTIDLRKNRWQERRKVEGPKKIDEVHRDAAQERQGQAGRLSRGPSMNYAMRRGQPLEYGSRGSMLPSPGGQMGGYRGMGTQLRGYGGQDARVDDKSAFQNRTFSVPLLQRSTGDEPIMLGPQGGLGRGMSCRGQPSVSSTLTADNSSSHGEFRRVEGGLNGSTDALGPGASSRGDHFPRQTGERQNGPAVYDQSGNQELSSDHTNREPQNSGRSVNRSMPPSSLVGQAAPTHNRIPEEVYPEERLQDMSIAAIKEYYSAKDKKELESCIKDLHAPRFYPMMIAVWVTDAFERKNLERDMLAKLLVSLTKSQEHTFSQPQLVEGVQSVLTNLEDTVNDAPKAPEFLGQIFGTLILEDVLSLQEVGRLVQLSGEEPGCLIKVGLAAKVLASILEMIKSEKGDSTLNTVRASSNLRLEDFLPPGPLRCEKLETFI